MVAVMSRNNLKTVRRLTGLDSLPAIRTLSFSCGSYNEQFSNLKVQDDFFRTEFVDESDDLQVNEPDKHTLASFFFWFGVLDWDCDFWLFLRLSASF